MGKCYIVGAGEPCALDFTPGADDFVIAADGGYEALCRAGMRVDLLVGDFDSMEKPDFSRIVPLPVRKDDTDTMHAIKEGLKRGYACFHFYGVTGGRISHTFAAVQGLSYLLDHGARGVIHGKRERMTMIRDASISFESGEEGFISVFCYGEKATGVSEHGLLYLLDRVTLANSFPLGVSNEFVGTPARIAVEHGTLLIVWGEAKQSMET